MMDMVIEGTCVACAIDRTGYVQQKKHLLLKRIYSSFNTLTLLQQYFKKEGYFKKLQFPKFIYYTQHIFIFMLMYYNEFALFVHI